MISSPIPLNKRLSHLLLGVALVLGARSASSETIYWDGPTGAWNDVTNWTIDPAATTPNPSAVPGIADSVFFNRNTTNANAVISLNAPQSAGTLTFRQTGTTDLRGGGTNQTLTIGTGGITKSSGSGIATIGSATSGENVGVILGGSQTWTNSSASSLTILNGITGTAGSQTLTMDVASGGIAVTGGITDGSGGTVALIKNGVSALSLRSSSSYTGTTTLNAGSINNGGGSAPDITSAAGTGQLIINGGSISNNASGGSSNFSFANSSQVWAGDFGLSTGTSLTIRLSLGAAAANPITLTGNRIVSTSGSSLNSSININGAIGDGGNAYNMTWAGNGNVRVNLGTAASTYTGTTTILSSMLQFGTSVGNGVDSVFGNSTSAILLGNTTGNVAAGILANAGNFSFARDITVQSGGTGTIVIGGVANSGTTGASMNNTGTITLGTGTTGRGVTLHRGNFSGNIVDPSGLLSSPGVVTITSHRATNGNTENSFSTVLSGNNTFTGGVNLTNDTNGNNNTVTLVMNSSTAIGTGTLTIGSAVNNLAIDSTAVGGTVLSTNNAQVWNGNATGSFTFTGTQNLDMGTGAVSLGTAGGTTRTVTTVANTLSVGGAISDGTTAVNLTKAGNGALVLYGASTYSGVTTISAGALHIGRGGSTGSLATSGVVNNGTLVFNRSDSALVFSAPISGTGGVTQAGTGRTTLTGAHTYTGATTINSGTFLVNGSLAAGSAVALNGATLGGSGTIAGLVTTGGTTSIIAPGNSPGTLSLTGGLNASLGATFSLELGASSDLLDLGSGTFTGSTADDGLIFNFSNSGGLLAGNPYTLIEFGLASGLQYSDLLAMTTPSGFVLDTSYGTDGFLIDGSSLRVQFSAIPEPSAFLLMISGMGMLGLSRRSRSRRRLA